MTETNPLSQYFRVPGIHVSLPSGGKYTKPEDIELGITGELPVFPMTAKDEIWSKNPDGLLNGYSIEHIIKSCVPGIKSPKTMPAVDIDYLLLAIKKATYGPTLTLSAKCPKCSGEHDFELPIDDIMNRVVPLPEEVSVRLADDLLVYLRPHNYEAATKTNIAAFEETKLLQMIVKAEWDDAQRLQIFSNSFDKISNLNLDLLSSNIEYIVVGDKKVTDPNFIREFVLNTDREKINKIQDGMKQFQDAGIDRKTLLVCPTEDCQHEWQTEIIFDPSHFFE